MQILVEPPWQMETNFPALQGESEADLVVVGAGITGLASAYYTGRSGLRVAVLDQGTIPAGATRYSSGILYFGTGTDLQTAIDLFGAEKAKLIFDESRQSIAELLEVARDQKIDCGLRSPGAVMVARTEEEVRTLGAEADAMKQLGYASEWLTSAQLKSYFGGKEFLAGLRQPECHQIQAGAFVAEFARRVPARVYAQSAMVSLQQDGTSVRITTERGMIHARTVLLATNLEPSFGLDKFFFTENSAVLMSQPLAPAQIRKCWPRETILWTLDKDYDILYSCGLTLCLEVFHLKGATEKVKDYYPGVDFQLARRWGDSWAKTHDWLPMIGKLGEKHPHVVVAKAVGDQGISMGWTAGRKMPLILSGKTDPFLRLTTPQRFPIGD